jgi:hypothetical protein
MARHLPDLCERIGKVTGRPVIDKTGLDGDYMIHLVAHRKLDERPVLALMVDERGSKLLR